jgi:hypothetical protein
MKANELRIGNYAQDQEGNLLKVISIDKDNVSYEVVDRSKFPLKKGWKAIPIPITEEILLKCGFEKYAESVVCCGWFIGTNPLTHDYLLKITWMKNEDGSNAEIFYKNGHFVIKYLHQLQKLYFALTGEELEVNL